MVDIVGVLRCMLHPDAPSSEASAVGTFESELRAYIRSRKGRLSTLVIGLVSAVGIDGFRNLSAWGVVSMLSVLLGFCQGVLC